MNTLNVTRTPAQAQQEEEPAELPRKWVMELPLPPKACSPNCNPASRQGRMFKASETKKYRNVCHWLFASAQLASHLPTSFKSKIMLHLEFYLSRDNLFVANNCYFPRDEMNARSSFKGGQDALQDCGLIPSDSARYVSDGTTRLYTTAKQHEGRACVVLTIEEVRE